MRLDLSILILFYERLLSINKKTTVNGTGTYSKVVPIFYLHYTTLQNAYRLRLPDTKQPAVSKGNALYSRFFRRSSLIGNDSLYPHRKLGCGSGTAYNFSISGITNEGRCSVGGFRWCGILLLFSLTAGGMKMSEKIILLKRVAGFYRGESVLGNTF